MPVITAHWAHTSPDSLAHRVALGILEGFTRFATRAGVRSWHHVDPALIGRFLREGPNNTPDVRQLRKNSLHAVFLALKVAGLWPNESPAIGLLPAPARPARPRRARDGKAPTRYQDRVHVRPPTHDEMLLIRLGSQLAGSNRATYLSWAAVAICSATATSSEAVQVLWPHLTLNGDHPQIALLGRAAAPGRESTAIAARSADLDPWSAHGLSFRHDELSQHRPVSATASVLYSGSQALDSNSAQVGADQQVRKALTIGDLRDQPGLTAGSLRLWGATRDVVDIVTAARGASLAGIHPFTLHRQITRGGHHALVF